LIKKLLLIDFAVFLPPQVGVDLSHSLGEGDVQAFFQWAAIEVEGEQVGQIGELPWYGNYVSVFQIKFLPKV